jgi:hypothetical protein
VADTDTKGSDKAIQTTATAAIAQPSGLDLHPLHLSIHRFEDEVVSLVVAERNRDRNSTSFQFGDDRSLGKVAFLVRFHEQGGLLAVSYKNASNTGVKVAPLVDVE